MRRRYKCNAKTGTRLADECQVEMSYEEYYEHSKKHHRKRLYRCTLCSHEAMYETPEELAEEHWMKNCHSKIFHPVYQLCRTCGKRLKQRPDGTVLKDDHNCEDILREEVKELE